MNRWSVLVAGPAHTAPVELPPGRPVVVGHGPQVGVPVDAGGVEARHCSLLARDDGVVLERLRGGGEVQVNDVAVAGQVVLRAGDEVRVGDARLIVALAPAPLPRRPRVAGPDEFMSRLDDELRRQGATREVGLALVSAPGLNVAARHALLRRVIDEIQRTGHLATFGELAADLFAVLLPELPGGEAQGFFARLKEVAGPRAAVATGRAPFDGLDAETLLGNAGRGLWGESPGRTEPVWADPVMVRLQALAEGLADAPGHLCAVGPAGSGRSTLLEAVARAAGRRAPSVSALDAEALSRAANRPGEWVLVRELDRLAPATARAFLERARARVLATAATRPAAGLFPHVLEVPPLRARPDDVLPLAEAFVMHARLAVGRPRLTLGAEARALLVAWSWPGNVRELENVLLRAARAAVRDELGRDALPEAFSADAHGDDFKGAMRSAERELLLEALARTRWNVTAAAARLGMPRRTVVYRMARLGLKRPARGKG